MKLINISLIFILMGFLFSCQPVAVGDFPKEAYGTEREEVPAITSSFNAADTNEDTNVFIDLPYSHKLNLTADGCLFSGLENLTITQDCACDSSLCRVRVKGVTDFVGVGKFTYAIKVGDTYSLPAVVTMNILPVEDSPTVSNFTASSFAEETSSAITLPYHDGDGDIATSCNVSNLNNISVTQNCACSGGVCTVTVQGAPNFNGVAGFSYAVTTNSQPSNTANVSFVINPVDDAPVASNFNAVAFNEDTTSLITLSYHDAESDDADSCSTSSLSNITVTSPCACSGGVCVVGVRGTADYSGPASFDFSVTSNGLTSNMATASLSISPVDDAPVASNITPAPINEDTESDIVLSYTDKESDPGSACTVSGLNHLTVTQGCQCSGGVCSVRVKGTSNYFGNANFNYTVTTNGLTSNSATASLTINPVDDAPIANNILPANFNEDTSSTITLSYTDQESNSADTCTIKSSSNITIESSCTCTLGLCSVTVKGTPNYTGLASFNYTVTSNTLESNEGIATLNISPVDDAPVANNFTAPNFAQDTESFIQLSYTDIESDKGTLCTVTNPDHITVTTPCSCDGAGICTVGVTGSPLHYNGPASFTFTVKTNSLTSTTAIATLNISDVNDAPTVANFTATAFNEDTQSTITLPYTDVDGDQASSCLVSGLNNVSVTQSCACAAGVCSISIQGLTNFNGNGSFTYSITANSQTSNTATVSFTINPVDDAPVASNFTAPTFNEDTISVITLSYSDPESDQASTCSTSNITNITVTTPCACAAGVCTVGVRGTANYSGPASFDFGVTANGLTSSNATATLSIAAVDDAPVALNLTAPAFNEDTISVITLSYTDTESDQADTCSTSSLSNITVTSPCTCAAGVCTVGVRGTSNYSGAASFDFTVTDNGLTSNTATASLTINPVDDAPVAGTISPLAMNEDTPTWFTLSYSDIENHLATTCQVSALNKVEVTQSCACDGAGICKVQLKGESNYFGGAGFDFTVTANGQTSSAASATLSISNVDDAPIANNFTAPNFAQDTEAFIQLSYTDIESDKGTLCTVSNPDHVTITTPCSCDGAGICTVGVTGSPLHYNGPASFSFTVKTNNLTSAAAVATLNISDVNDAPTVANFTATAFNEDTQSTITLPYTDVDGDQAASCTVGGLNNVSVTQSCACAAGVCSVSIQGLLNYNGSGSFTYSVTANSQTSNTAVVSLPINPVDDAPVASNFTAPAFNEDTISVITLSYGDPESDQASTCSTSGISNITVTSPCACAAGVCTVGVRGTANYSGAASFDFTVVSNGLTSNTSTATLSITPVDDAPVAVNLTAPAFNEDTTSVITLSYTDTESDHADSCSTSSLANITVTSPCACAAGVCTVGVRGTSNYSGSASFDFTVTDNGLTSNTATASLTINPVDDAPVAIDILPANFNEDTSSTITLSYTDQESNLADSCTIKSSSNISVQGSCTCALGTCSVTVKGTQDFNGLASFNYTVTSNSLESNEGVATLNISAVDDAPVANNFTAPNFTQDTESFIQLSYTDIESDKGSICTVTNPDHITVTTPCSCDGSGVCTVGVTGSPLHYNGPASFSFTVKTNNLTSAAAVATLNISDVNDAPTVANFTATAFNEDTPSTITLPYNDVDGDQASACTVGGLNNVSVTQSCTCASGTCSVAIQGLANFNGNGSFTYSVTANSQTSNTATVSFTVNPVDDAPVTASFTAPAFNEDTISVITLSYSDVESDQADSCNTSSLSNITVTTPCACAAGICTVGVRGISNYSGAASFDFTVTDNGLTSNSSTATLAITAVDDAPVASNLTAPAFNEDTISVITLSYTDTESDQADTCSTSSLSNITVTSPCACAAGVCTVGVQGTANYSGPASFDFTVTDNGLTSNTATASLTINPVDDAPVANDILPANFDEDTSSTITLSYTDQENNTTDSCTIKSSANITIQGSCTCALGVCSVTVKGTQNFYGLASFNYTVTSNSLESNEGVATLNISAVDDAPVANNFTAPHFAQDTESFIQLNYTDVESHKATQCTVTNPDHVTITTPCSCDGAGTCTVGVTGSPLNYNGPASFNFSVKANNVDSGIALATLNISDINDAPTVANFTATAFNEDTQSNITLPYTDADGDQADSCTVGGLNNVSVTQSCACTAGVCSVSIQGLTNFNGNGSFTYSINANSQTSNTATVSFTINPVDDAPVASSFTAPAFNEDTISVVTLSYSDPESDLADTCSTSGLGNITVTSPCACAAGVCTVGVRGTADYSGPASFDFTVGSNGLTSNSSTATLAITAVDDAPVATNFSAPAFNEDTISVITLSYTDTESDQADSCSTSSLSNITVTTPCACAAGVCTVSVRGTANYSGPASFDFTVTDNGLTSNTATASLTINPVDDAPVASTISPLAMNEDTPTWFTLSYSDTENNLATACQLSSLNKVEVVQTCACDGAGVCTVQLKGESNYYGAAGFNFTVTANGQTSAAASAALSISNIDDAPVAQDITPLAIPEDTDVEISLSYTDTENDSATSCDIVTTDKVSVTQACACASGICKVRIQSDTDYNGSASFTYKVTANGAQSNIATASLTISGVDDAPVGVAATPTTFNEDTETEVTLQYTDTENHQASACSLSGLNQVTVSQACACSAGVCTAKIIPDANYSGTAGFSFTVTANTLTSAPTAVALTVSPVDDAPIAQNISPGAFNEDVSSVIALSYTDAENNGATSCSVSGESNISVITPCSCSSGICQVEVKGTANFNGGASFNYTVTANGLISNSATATLSITPVDDAPTVANFSAPSFPKNTESIITLTYSDIEGNTASSCSVTNPPNATVSTACSCSAGLCTVGITGDNNFTGSSSFNYTVMANGLPSNSGTVSLNITNSDTAPTAVAFTAPAFNEDAESDITLQYTDPDNDLASSCSVNGLSNITVVRNCACTSGTCTVGVKGTSNYAGAGGFSFTVTAAGVVSNSAAVTFTINPVDDAPVAANITPSPFNEDTESVITLNYSDVESHEALTCSLSNLNQVSVSTPCACALGVCTVGVTGAANYFGAASFDYTVVANGLTSNTATASLSISAVNDNPVAQNLTPAAFNEDVTSTISLSYTDTEADLATTCSISNLTNVTVVNACSCSSGSCSVGVRGTSNYNGAATFTYTVTANGGVSNQATATLTINAVDDTPVASNLSSSVAEDTETTITLNYSDIENDQASTCSVSNLTNLSVTQACACAAGVCTFKTKGSSDFSGTGTFDYTVTANGATSNTASGTITITPVDDAPIANNLLPSSFNEDTNSTINLSYTDPEFDQATACTISNLQNLTVVSSCTCTLGSCSVTIKGTSNFNGLASFDYTVTANGKVSNVAYANYTISPVDDAPTTANFTPASFNEDTASIITLSYSDIESDKAVSCTVSGLTNVSITQACSCNVAGVCTVGVQGSANYNGSGSFSFAVTANGQTSNTSTASFTISAVDDAPVANNITPPSFVSGTVSTITLSYSDTESDLATSCSISGLTNVTVAQACSCTSGTCTVGIQGNSGYSGAASFQYTVSSNALTSNAATASLTITAAVNAAPTISAISNTGTNYQTASAPIVFTIADTDTSLTCNSSFLSMTSSNTALVPIANVTWTQVEILDAATRTCSAVITPANGQSGSSTLTFTVNDGAGGTASSSFTFTVSDANIQLQWFPGAMTGAALNNPANQISSFDWGSKSAGTTNEQAFKLVNNGTNTATGLTIALESGSATFTIVTTGGKTTCGTSLAAAASCTVTLQWRSNGNSNMNQVFTATFAAKSGTYAGRLTNRVLKVP